ncbi:HDOD domain-containing protein [Nitrincola tapanii]|nr:HDOD domain-containing protein [Nitrincola tapanii]
MTPPQAASPAPTLYGLDAWLNFLVDKTLPIRASTRQRLLKLLQNPNSNLLSLIPVAQQDPVLCLHLTRAAQALHQSKDSQVSGVSHAIQTLGFERIQALIKEMPVLKINIHQVAHKMFYRATADSHHASTQAWSWAEQKKMNGAEELRLAALLYGFVHWMVWFYAPRHKHAYQERVYQQKQDVALAEHEVFGCTLQALGLELAKAWQLPELIQQALDHDTSPSARMLQLLHLKALGDPRLTEAKLREVSHFAQTRAFPVKLANWLALTATRGWQSPKAQRLFDIISDYLNQSKDQTLAQLHQHCALSSRLYPLPGVLTPAAELLFIPAKMEFTPGLLSAAEIAKLGPDVPEVQPVAHLQTEPAPTPSQIATANKGFRDEDFYQRTLLNLQKASRQTLTSASLMRELLKGLHQGLGLKRLALLQIQPGRKLKTVFQQGFDQHPMDNFSLDLEIPSLFKRMVEKPSFVWLTSEQREKLAPLLPASFLALEPPSGALLLSLFTKNMPLAIVYADMGADLCLEDPFFAEHFRSLCSQASQALKTLNQD